MKLVLFSLAFLSLAVTYSQTTISESGNWCDATLTITADLGDETISHWTKDGILLEGENTATVNCASYGAGTYEISLITDGETISSSYTTSTPEPIVDYTSTYYPAADATLFSATILSSDEIVSWNWTFDNGDTSTIQNPNKMVDNSTEYSVILSVVTASGCNYTIMKKHNLED